MKSKTQKANTSRVLSAIFVFSLLVLVVACVKKPDKLLPELRSEWNAHVKAGKLVDAEQTSRQMLEVADQLNGEQSIEYAGALSKMALTKQFQGKYDEAISWFTKELELNKALLGPNHPNVALSLSNIGFCHKLRSDYKSAIDALKKSLEVFSQSKSLLKDEGSYIHTYHLLSSVYFETGRYDESAAILQAAINTPYVQNVQDTVQVVAVLTSMALVSLERQDLQLTEVFSRRAFALSRKAFSSWSIQMSDVLNIMGGLAKAQKDYQSSEDAFFMSLRIRDSLGIRDDYYALTLNNIATLYISMEQYLKADSLLYRAEALFKSLGGENSLQMATVFRNKSSVAINLGQFKDAEQYKIRALNIYEQKAGPNSMLVLGVLESLLDLYTKTNRQKDAVVVETRIRQIKAANLAT